MRNLFFPIVQPLSATKIWKLSQRPFQNKFSELSFQAERDELQTALSSHALVIVVMQASLGDLKPAPGGGISLEGDGSACGGGGVPALHCHVT